MNEPTGVESSSGRTWPVLFGYVVIPPNRNLEYVGTLEVSGSLVRLRRGGKAPALELNAYLGYLVVGASILVGAAAWTMHLVFFLAAGALTLASWGIVLLQAKVVQQVRLRKVSAIEGGEEEVAFDPSKGRVSYDRRKHLAIIVGPKGRQIRVALNSMRCEASRRKAREAFEAELARCFGERFEVK